MNDNVPQNPPSPEPELPPESQGTPGELETTGKGFRLPTFGVGRILRWSLVVLLVLSAIWMTRRGVVHVRENQVGVLVNNLTGQLSRKDRVGYHLFVPYVCSFYTLEKTIQKLDLSFTQAAGAVPREVRLKTSDGSDVRLDVTINFKMIPEQAIEVLQRSGPGLRYAEVWMEPFARHACMASFGELTTEEIYDAKQRNRKAELARERLNTLLGPQGIEVIAVIPGEFRFYPEYEQVITEKKLADQQVEEQQAQARAALEDQRRQVIEAEKQVAAKETAFEGEMNARLIQANADADKTRREADGYYAGTLLTADAGLYSASAEAVGKRASLLAEADGMQKMRQAMSGGGGAGMVGLEYAKRLAGVRFIGTPITRDAHVQQLAISPSQAGAAAAPAPNPASGPPGPPIAPAAVSSTPGGLQ